MKKQPRRRLGADIELPGDVVEHLNKLADEMRAGAVRTMGKLPRGYDRNNLRRMVHAIARRSLADNGPDLPINEFETKATE